MGLLEWRPQFRSVFACFGVVWSKDWPVQLLKSENRLHNSISSCILKAPTLIQRIYGGGQKNLKTRGSDRLVASSARIDRTRSINESSQASLLARELIELAREYHYIFMNLTFVN